MTLPTSKRRELRRRPPFASRRLAPLAPAAIALIAVVAAAGCGGSSSTAAQTSQQKVQIMATVTRGDLVQTVMTRLKVTKDGKGGATGVGQVAKSSAASVSTGQSVKVYFVTRPTGMSASPGVTPSPGAGQSGQYPSPMPSGTAPGREPQGYGAGPGFGRTGNFANAKSADGTVTSTATNSGGSLTIHVTIAKLPSGLTDTSTAIAQVSQQTLAKDVLLLPLAAVSGSGSNATVTVVSNGKSEKRKVVVGKRTLQQVEIVSGLSEGDNVIYERKFNGFPGMNRGQRSSPGAYPTGMPGGATGE
jgi:hypothetical protein